MIGYPSRFSNSPEALPNEFAPELRDLDAKLSQLARRSSAPAGLAEKVLAASTPVLQSAGEIVSRPPLRLVRASRRVPLHRATWARLALAACLTFACTLAFLTMQRPAASDRTVAGASHAPASEPMTLALEMPHESVSAEYESSLGYLRDTMDLPYDDLKSDLALLASRF